MTSDARTLSDWLHRQPNAVRDALSRSRQLAQINRAFNEWLAEPWTADVRLASLGDTAVFYATHAGAATLLRYRAPDVLTWLRQRYNPACTHIEIKVRPDT
jgi:hypothetical protein